MRIALFPVVASLALIPLLAIGGCSGGGGGGNTVDVAAAASKAESDIANYAAMPDAGAPAAAPSPAASTTPVAGVDDVSPAGVVRRYTNALAARRYDEAWALWDDGGAASGMTREAFAASFERYATYRATVGTPFDADAGAGQRYITVPVVVTGSLKSGGPFRLEGPVVLHKAADGIESDDPHAHDWRIRSSEMKPRPVKSATTID
ncbi:hypothetical protein [Sphingomonas sp. Leaf37]|uniref:hypothetical protein n=1 Tax=Sphingomonas sp. Leaf37 TaxID=2876552 RepID=UPI001E3E91D5|nr:hypothetical protein [Sphingomonas sp. Leaf37]